MRAMVHDAGALCTRGEPRNLELPLADNSGMNQETGWFRGILHVHPVFTGTMTSEMSGVFYCGDNLEILDELRLIPDESVDLIYLDPPFNSRRAFNVVYKDSRAQELAFKDYWSWEEAAPLFTRLVDGAEAPPRLRSLLRGYRDVLIEQDADLLAYLSMMTPRLVALHRVLKSTGSLYLHCDPTASHYLKAIMDAIFGADRFENEVIWKRFSSKNDPKRYGRVHDTILFYTKSSTFTWHPQRTPVEEYSIDKNFTDHDDGRRFTLVDLTANKPGGDTDYEWHGVRPYKGRHWAYSREKMDQMFEAGLIVFRRTGMPRLKRYLDEQEGAPLQDVWTDIKLATSSKERVGYPTQKPLALLERILQGSSNPGDVVLDPFCGCGTTIEACERMGRRWIGIDIARKAVEIAEERFKKQDLEAPTIEWVPPDVDAAAALARNGLKFEEWVRRKIRAVRYRKKDRGIDGEALFHDGQRSTHVLISVKGGKLNPAMVRELRGTMERERVPIAVLVSMQEPSKEMRREATHAGFIQGPDGRQIPRLQLLTVEQILEKRRRREEPIDAPGRNVTEMPPPTVPTGVPKNYEQMALKLDTLKPPKKARKGKAPEAAQPAAEVSTKRKSARPGG